MRARGCPPCASAEFSGHPSPQQPTRPSQELWDPEGSKRRVRIGAPQGFKAGGDEVGSTGPLPPCPPTTSASGLAPTPGEVREGLQLPSLPYGLSLPTHLPGAALGGGACSIPAHNPEPYWGAPCPPTPTPRELVGGCAWPACASRPLTRRPCPGSSRPWAGGPHGPQAVGGPDGHGPRPGGGAGWGGPTSTSKSPSPGALGTRRSRASLPAPINLESKRGDQAERAAPAPCAPRAIRERARTPGGGDVCNWPSPAGSTVDVDGWSQRRASTCHGARTRDRPIFPGDGSDRAPRGAPSWRTGPRGGPGGPKSGGGARLSHGGRGRPRRIPARGRVRARSSESPHGAREGRVEGAWPEAGGVASIQLWVSGGVVMPEGAWPLYKPRAVSRRVGVAMAQGAWPGVARPL